MLLSCDLPRRQFTVRFALREGAIWAGRGHPEAGGKPAVSAQRQGTYRLIARLQEPRPNQAACGPGGVNLRRGARHD